MLVWCGMHMVWCVVVLFSCGCRQYVPQVLLASHKYPVSGLYFCELSSSLVKSSNDRYVSETCNHLLLSPLTTILLSPLVIMSYYHLLLSSVTKTYNITSYNHLLQSPFTSICYYHLSLLSYSSCCHTTPLNDLFRSCPTHSLSLF
jgi:hypothetical protein